MEICGHEKQSGAVSVDDNGEEVGLTSARRLKSTVSHPNWIRLGLIPANSHDDDYLSKTMSVLLTETDKQAPRVSGPCGKGVVVQHFHLKPTRL